VSIFELRVSVEGRGAEGLHLVTAAALTAETPARGHHAFTRAIDHSDPIIERLMSYRFACLQFEQRMSSSVSHRCR
jgi:hypothetical protein